MRRMGWALVGAVFSACWVGPVSAGGLEGAYLGGQVGALYGASEVSYSDANDTASVDGVSTTGIIGGVFGGYGFRSNNLYIGGELDFSVSSADTTATLNGASASLDVERLYFINARLGYYLSEKALGYVKVGVGRLDWEASSSQGFSDDGSQNGFRVGLGFEHQIGESFSIRGEGAYTAYEDYSESQGAETVSVDPTSISFLLGAAYHF